MREVATAAQRRMNRHQARELAFSLLFEHEFNREVAVGELYDVAKQTRDAEENKYVRTVARFILNSNICKTRRC